MELFSTSDYYIIRQGEHSLWCSRKTGHLEPRIGMNVDIKFIRKWLLNQLVKHGLGS